MPNIKSILTVAETYFKMVTEANHSAQADAASDRAKNTPSVATHHAASTAHETAASALEAEVDKMKESDPTGKNDEKVMGMERQIKSHQQQAQRHRFHAHRIASTQKESFELTEKLDPKADAGTWIHDFVHSDDPKFAGKSAEERKNQALAAYYQARRDAGLKNEDTGEAGDQSNERPEVDLKPDTDNLAATDAADAQKKQDPQGEIPSWVPGNIENKKEFAEAAKKAWESDNNTFDFKGRTYKITEKLVGNQDKLDVNGNGKIDADDLKKLRAGHPANENLDKETETPGQETEMPEGQPRGDGDNDEDDKTDMGDDDKDQGEMKESTQLNEGPGQSTYARVATDRAEEASKRANSYGGQDYHLHMIAHHSHALAAKSHERAAGNADDENTAADHSGGASYHHDQADHHLKAANALKESTDLSEASAAELGHKARGLSSGAKTPADHKAAAKAHAKAAEAYRRYTTGNAGKNPGKSEEAAHSAALAHEKMADKHHEKSMKESVDDPTDKLTIDVPAMIRALEKAREDFKTDKDIHNFVQGLLTKKDAEIKTNDLPGETVKEGAPGDAKAGPMVMDPLTQDTKDDHDEETKVEDAPYTNKADGSENIVPANKPQPNPTPMNKVTDAQATKSVAEAYAKMNEAKGQSLGANAAAAWDASDHADDVGTKEAHAKAHFAHVKVMHAYAKAGRHDAAKRHMDAAEHHNAHADL